MEVPSGNQTWKTASVYPSIDGFTMLNGDFQNLHVCLPDGKICMAQVLNLSFGLGLLTA